MSSLTRSKVAYDLNISPHKYEVTYDDQALTFVFSSALYLKKFVHVIDKNREKINESLSNRFGFRIINNELADLKTYSTIEKRGFLIYKGQVKFECLNNIILDGHRLMMKP